MLAKKFETQRDSRKIRKFFNIWKSRIINSLLKRDTRNSSSNKGSIGQSGSKGTLKFSAAQNSVSIENKKGSKKQSRPGLYEKDKKKSKKTNLVTEEVQATPIYTDSSEDDDILVAYTHELIEESKKVTKSKLSQLNKSSDSDFDNIPEEKPKKEIKIQQTQKNIQQKPAINKPLSTNSDDSIDELISNVKDLVAKKPSQVTVTAKASQMYLDDEIDEGDNLEKDLALRSVLEAARRRQGARMIIQTEFDDKESDDVDKEITERRVNRISSPKKQSPVPQVSKNDSQLDIELDIAQMRQNKQQNTNIVFNSSDIEKEVNELKKSKEFKANLSGLSSPIRSPKQESKINPKFSSPIRSTKQETKIPSNVSSPISSPKQESKKVSNIPSPSRQPAPRIEFMPIQSSESEDEGEDIHKYLNDSADDENADSEPSFEEEFKIGAYLKQKRAEFQNNIDNDDLMMTTRINLDNTEIHPSPIKSVSNQTPSKLSPTKLNSNSSNEVTISPMKPSRMDMVSKNSNLLTNSEENLLKSLSPKPKTQETEEESEPETYTIRSKVPVPIDDEASEEEIQNLIAESKARGIAQTTITNNGVGWSTESESDDGFTFAPKQSENTKIPSLKKLSSDSDEIEEFCVKNSKWNAEETDKNETEIKTSPKPQKSPQKSTVLENTKLEIKSPTKEVPISPEKKIISNPPQEKTETTASVFSSPVKTTPPPVRTKKTFDFARSDSDEETKPDNAIADLLTKPMPKILFNPEEEDEEFLKFELNIPKIDKKEEKSPTLSSSGELKKENNSNTILPINASSDDENDLLNLTIEAAASDSDHSEHKNESNISQKEEIDKVITQIDDELNKSSENEDIVLEKDHVFDYQKIKDLLKDDDKDEEESIPSIDIDKKYNELMNIELSDSD
ncbi:hypothetical protein TVAGG3_0311920 [Trichomonas vaginalis G3]|uniref:hypothetical protein n=1 Tax=Trichomonas vaginalis (strain ATCC PRA-98 / G3) TaxID=412133 RepID=UPI0021E5798D|nr:hypothetical protein TVAGG3_0311920 [Trichomonas vaginalis G3]KAI5528679.1 hypothetical protein TVAGG3_0311920 [Trichomonas vaginalis G3]